MYRTRICVMVTEKHWCLGKKFCIIIDTVETTTQSQWSSYVDFLNTVTVWSHFIPYINYCLSFVMDTYVHIYHIDIFSRFHCQIVGTSLNTYGLNIIIEIHCMTLWYIMNWYISFLSVTSKGKDQLIWMCNLWNVDFLVHSD